MLNYDKYDLVISSREEVILFKDIIIFINNNIIINENIHLYLIISWFYFTDLS